MSKPEAPVESKTDTMTSYVQDTYGRAANGENIFGDSNAGRDFQETSRLLGYTEEDLEEAGNLGLGCGEAPGIVISRKSL